MVASLPQNIQLKLNQALNQWRQWRCDPPLERPPEAISVLGDGVSNHSILVEAGQRFVIRIDGIRAANNGLSRATEWRALITAHNAGLAPAPRYFNPELGVLVCDYLIPAPSYIADPVGTATLLRAIHALPGCHHRLDLTDRIFRYERLLDHQNMELPPIMKDGREEIISLLDVLSSEREVAVLCHNDLLAANRVYSENKLWALDWEYCAMGSPWFDLAAIAVGDSMSAQEQQKLVDAYLCRPADEGEGVRFVRYCNVYRYLELLWYLANKPMSDGLTTRLTALKSALG